MISNSHALALTLHFAVPTHRLPPVLLTFLLEASEHPAKAPVVDRVMQLTLSVQERGLDALSVVADPKRVSPVHHVPTNHTLSPGDELLTTPYLPVGPPVCTPSGPLLLAVSPRSGSSDAMLMPALGFLGARAEGSYSRVVPVSHAEALTEPALAATLAGSQDAGSFDQWSMVTG
ncbi:hypothetical protein VTI74DRAFT_7043 [Chaetomium olivicolor]